MQPKVLKPDQSDPGIFSVIKKLRAGSGLTTQIQIKSSVSKNIFIHILGVYETLKKNLSKFDFFNILNFLIIFTPFGGLK